MSVRLDPRAVSVEEASALAEEAFVFGLPLVYIAVQIDTATNVASPGRGRAPLGQFAHFRAAARCFRSGRRRAQRRHAVFAGERRSRAGARGAVGARDGRPLLADAAHRRVEQRPGRSGLADAAAVPAGTSRSSARVEGSAARRSHRAANADQPGHPRRPDLRLRARGRHCRARAAGPVPPRAAEGMGQRLDAAGRGAGAARRRRQDAGATAGARDDAARRSSRG